MNETAHHAALGNLIWESPTVQPAPKLASHVFCGVFLLLGVVICGAAVPMLANFRDPLDRNGGVAGGVVGLALLGAGVWIFVRSRGPRRLPGIQFFQQGLEFGPLRNRRSVTYEELESITFEPLDVAADQRDRMAAGARLALSLIAGNPASVGYALAQLTDEKVESIAVIQLPGEAPFRVAMSDGFGEQVEAAVLSSRPLLIEAA